MSVTPAERLVCLAAATGLQPREISQQIPSLSTQKVNKILASPLAKVLVDQFVKEITERGLQSAVSRLGVDTPKNLSFLIDARDGKFDGTDPDDMRVRMKASETLFDRQMPKRTESTTEATLRITVERPEREAIDAVCEEIGEPIPLIALPAPTLDTGPLARVEPVELDSLLEKYAEPE